MKHKGSGFVPSAGKGQVLGTAKRGGGWEGGGMVGRLKKKLTDETRSRDVMGVTSRRIILLR